MITPLAGGGWTSPALAAGLEAEERSRRLMRLTAALKRRAASSIEIVYAPAMDDSLRLVAEGATVYSTAASGTVRITATRTGFTLDTVDGPELPVTVPGAALSPNDRDLTARSRT